MASMTSVIQSPIRICQLPTLPLTPNRTVPASSVVVKCRSLASKALNTPLSPMTENRTVSPSVELCSKAIGLLSSRQPLTSRSAVRRLVVRAAAADADGASDGLTGPSKSFAARFPALVTGFYFFMWYFLNVIFNILNKNVYNYFPYPYFVSVIHLLVGVGYCLISWAVGLPKRAPMDKELLLLLTPVSLCHALGHVMSNVSFAAVAVSFTHTIKVMVVLLQRNG